MTASCELLICKQVQVLIHNGQRSQKTAISIEASAGTRGGGFPTQPIDIKILTLRGIRGEGHGSGDHGEEGKDLERLHGGCVGRQD